MTTSRRVRVESYEEGSQRRFELDGFYDTVRTVDVNMIESSLTKLKKAGAGDKASAAAVDARTLVLVAEGRFGLNS